MDKEFLNNLFLWLQELYNNTTGGQFGEYDEIETYGDVNENGYPEIIKIEKRPIEELYVNFIAMVLEAKKRNLPLNYEKLIRNIEYIWANYY